MKKKSRSILLSMLMISGCVAPITVNDVNIDPNPIAIHAPSFTVSEEYWSLLNTVEEMSNIALQDRSYWSYANHPWRQELYAMIDDMEELATEEILYETQQLKIQLRMGMELRDEAPINKALDLIQTIREKGQ